MISTISTERRDTPRGRLRAGLAGKGGASAAALAVLALLAMPGVAGAQDAVAGQPGRGEVTNAEGSPVRVSVDKSRYTLFNPTPDDQLRPFSSDRPSKSNSSFTIDAGHVQVESDFWNYTWDRFSRDRTTTRDTLYANPYIRLGVTNWAEVQVQVPLYESQVMRSRDGQGTMRARGFGDVQVGGKVNLFGNDGGSQALALYGLVKLPTAARGLGNNMVEFTLSAPYTVALPAKFSLTVEPTAGLMRNLNKQGYHGSYQFTADLNRPVIGEAVTAALELAAAFATDHNTRSRYTFDASLQWLVTPGLQLDAGVYVGLNKDAPDYNPYVGISFRY